MLRLSITFNEPAWPELASLPKSQLIDMMDMDAEISIAVLDAGMQSGKPAVALKMTLPDGQVLLGQTSARLFCGAARAIMGRYPKLFED